MNRIQTTPRSTPARNPRRRRISPPAPFASFAPFALLALFALSLALPACVTHDRKMYRQQPWRKQKPATETGAVELPPGVVLDPAPAAL